MSKTLAKYESFLIENVSTISSLESSLRSITWFLPGRFKDAELASESLSTLLNLMSMYHDTLLAKIVQNETQYKPLIPSSLHTRFTKAWSNKNARYKWTARALEIIKYTQLVLEMSLRRNVSAKSKWRGIILLEFIKAVLRIFLLRVTRRPLIHPPIPERDFDPAALPVSSTASSPTLAPSSPTLTLVDTPQHLKNNHVPLLPDGLLTPPPPLQSETFVEDYLLPKALTISSVKPSLSLVRPLSSVTDWVSEFIYILRPLVYAILISLDRRSSKPVVTALAMELVARNLRRTPPTSASLERAENAQRDRDMFWYFLRGSIWDTFSKPKLETVLNGTARLPLIGLFSTLAKEWVPLIDEYYYCACFVFLARCLKPM
ncbi:peroxisome membrane protein [Pterulicium gracile]|uniref:Peroxisomal membrane protein PEX16 n=1 Tax=Pterulicium gracile TaxID=1884261 RepID=A0A5C3QQU4_9AGAR|nr:peroxisome membrane protein [Pterula gracilis]